MMRKRKIGIKSRAQAAIELAVFGAIIIFIIGVIIRYTVNFSNSQTQALKSMRVALRESFRSTQSGDTTRNISSILYIEDRKDVDITGSGGKFGSEHRTPFIMQSGGTLSNNLFQPPTFGTMQELPLMDLFVNKQHFTLSMSDYKTYCFSDGCQDSPPEGAVNIEYIDPVAIHAWNDGNPMYGYDACPGGAGSECLVFYERRFNTNEYFNSATGGIVRNYFDYNRIDGCEATEPCSYPNDDDRARFAWQWHAVNATGDNVRIEEEGDTLSYDVDGDLKEEHIMGTADAAGSVDRYFGNYTTPDGRQYYMFPIGGAGRENFYPYYEGLHPSLPGTGFNQCSSREYSISYVNVIDQQLGDIDATYNSYDARGGNTPAEPDRGTPPSPGLKLETAIYTYTKDNTFYLIEEGRLYDPADQRQFVRNVKREDRMHLIERQFQLSNDTGRMCTPAGDNLDDGRLCHECNFDPGPVKDCCGGNSCINISVPEPEPGDPEPVLDCYTGINRFRTCFDRDTRILYIRSRIDDRRGRKWITDVSGDRMELE